MNSLLKSTADRSSASPHLLDRAFSLFSSGRPREALAIVTEVLKRAPKNPQALNLAGICSHSLGQLNDAENYWRRALTRNPDDVDVNNNVGMLLKAVKRFPEAEAVFRRALAMRPDHADARANLGDLLLEMKRFPEAEAAYLRTLEIRPGQAKVHGNLGVLLYETKRFIEAEEAYRRALAIEPEYAEAHANLGHLLHETKRYAEAEAAWRRTLEIRPDHVKAHSNLGALLSETKRFSEAEAAYRQALAIQPDYADAHHNLGNLLKGLKRFPEAEAAYRKALAIRPDDVETHANLGNLLYETKRFREAEAAYRRALSIHPDNAGARLSLGLLLLHTRRFAEGWALYEARYDEKNSSTGVRKPAFGYPQWQGESLAGKSIAILCEQGLGDSIQFVRYLPLVKARGARHITLICPQALRALFEAIDGADVVLVSAEIASMPVHDCWAFLLSLPLHLASTPDSVPGTAAYVQPTTVRLGAWKARLPASGLRVGLVWKGSPTHGNDRNRSLPALAALAPLWDVPGITFVSLQKGQGEDEATTPPPGQPLTHVGTDINDFADSAAIIAQMDLVICVDTAIAHLAGALGKPCWVLLPRVGTDWRWLEDRNDSPWYPQTMRLFRQSDQDDWAPTILAVAEALHRFAGVVIT